uniref:Leucine-rich repeat-containing N-terminal plant-type domain-containing protein n=1 Tax=Oryza punctata TaxID=4537 RepID=A0A0E0JVQ6_ORYPU
MNNPIISHSSYSNRSTSRFCTHFLGLVLVLLLLLVILFTSPAISCTEEDRSSLLRFLAGLSHNGGLAASWRPDDDCCHAWEGVVCDGEGTVTEVSLPSRGLHGRILPLSLANLTGLTCLNLSHNALSGGLPPELMYSASLLVLDVSFNSLDGALPPSPPLTTGLKQPLQLQVLNISTNNFHGEIPESIDQLKKLEVLRLSNNNMSGHLPSSLENCTRLTTIDLKMNSFSGDLGSVDFSSLHNLRALDLLHNNFSGVIPESIYSCNNLTALRLSSNQIQGEISSKIGDLKYLTFVSITENSFSDIAKTLHAFKSSRNLTTLFIGENFWGEVIPQDETIESLESIRHLSIYRCSLIGNIPLWLSKLKKLEVLDLSNNQLTGPMPSWINSFNNLFYLDVSNNSLTGQIPATLMELPMLKSDDYKAHRTILFDLPVYVTTLSRQYRAVTSFPALLNLSANSFTSVIPPKIGELKALTHLDFSSNQLQGEIPPSICNLTNLQVLDLSRNYLTGPIPEALNKLNFLSKFNISDNDLEGPIPTGGQMNTFSSSSFAGNPKLCGPMLLATCGSVEVAHTIPTISEDQQCSSKTISAIAFGVFFGIGVLYDQLVLSRYFGKINLKNEASPVSTISTKQYIDKVVFEVALGLFFGVGLIMREMMQMTPHFPCRCRLTMPFSGLAAALLLLLSMLTSAMACADQEKSSLLQFLYGLSQDGGIAMSWKNGMDCCTWEGITCSEDGEVVEVSLASKGLKGQISPTLGELTRLLHLNLSYNSLSGGLPVELMSSGRIVVLDVSFNSLNGDLQELNSSVSDHPLQILNISSNRFTGEFPSITWEKMRNLVAINASNNSFTGHIPSSFCNSSRSFAFLDLSYNQFSGNIPPEIGKCSALRMLKADVNNIIGPLPDALFNVTLLEYISFANNGLQGTINDALITKFSNLFFVDFAWNRFSGKIPNSIGQLKRLEELHMNNNNLSGELPSSLGNCTNLVTINLRSNSFTGELAKVNFSNLPNLITLDLATNYFTGIIPESIYSCSNLTWLRLSSNRLHGQLTNRIENLKAITFVSLSYNDFTNITNTLHILKNLRNLTALLIGGNFMHEAMPQDETIDGFENIQGLGINDCALSGKIPNWLSKLKKLEVLVLYNNQLSGPIPTWINSLNFLKYVDISNNSLTGEIPAALMEMPMLKSDKVSDNTDPRDFPFAVYVGACLCFQYRTANAFPKMLNLDNNKFTGAIPMEIGELKALVSLNLSFNNLNSEIPQSISNLKNLMVLDLSYNHLTGVIPPALVNLHFLSKFNVSYNDLEGPVPIGGQFSTFPSSSFAGNPKLCSPMLLHHCNSAAEDMSSPNSTKEYVNKVVFVIAFCVFFGVGVLYDQMVLPRYFCFRLPHSCVDDGGGGGSAGRRAMARLVFNVAEAPVGVGIGVGGWMTGEPMRPTNMSRT